jgi:hypothetical protein
MNTWLVAAIVVVVLFLTSCKCTCAWWAKSGPADIVDLDDSVDPFTDYGADFNAAPKPVDPLAEASMCPCGYEKGPILYKRNARERPMPVPSKMIESFASGPGKSMGPKKLSPGPKSPAKKQARKDCIAACNVKYSKNWSPPTPN